MKKIFSNYYRAFTNSLLFFIKSEGDKLTGIYLYFMFALFIYLQFKLKMGLLIGVIVFLILFVCIYLIGLVGYILVNVPTLVIYKGFDKISNKVNNYFAEDYSEFDYIELDEIPQLKRRFGLRSLPKIEVIYFWRYRVQTIKTMVTILLPVFAAIIISFVSEANSMFSEYEFYKNILSVLKMDIVKNYLIILRVAKYPYLVSIYFGKVTEMNEVLHKIDLLISLKTSNDSNISTL